MIIVPVMQIMAQVTVSLTSEQEEELEDVEDISDSDTVVGRLLEEDQDNRGKENWRKLVRKLSNKRNRKESAGKSKTTVEEREEEEEDNIPEDWRPDFIPRDWEVAESQQQQQPDLVQTTGTTGTSSAVVKFRSDHRRYLQREMGRMRRNSLAAETVEEEEEGEGEESFILEQSYMRPRLTM